MKTGMTRRQFQGALGWGAASIALTELGSLHPARAENGIKVSWEHAIDSVFTAKAMASCGNPPFSTLAVLQAEASFLALGGCLQDYNLDICTNYKDIIDRAKEPPRGGLKNWFAPFVLIVMGLVWNTKEAAKPSSYQDLMNPKYKGRVGIPTYGWVGNSWLQVLNKTLGGNEDNIDPAVAFLADLVKKNDPVILENTDAALKAFTRGEIVLMPFWNGRTFTLQAQGVPVDIEYVPGTMLVGNGFPVLKGGRFAELTNRYCNITMDGQYQTLMTQRFFYPPSNGKAKLPAELERYAFPKDREKNVVPIDYEKMNAHKAQYLDRWNKACLSG